MMECLLIHPSAARNPAQYSLNSLKSSKTNSSIVVRLWLFCGSFICTPLFFKNLITVDGETDNNLAISLVDFPDSYNRIASGDMELTPLMSLLGVMPSCLKMSQMVFVLQPTSLAIFLEDSPSLYLWTIDATGYILMPDILAHASIGVNRS